MIFGGFKGLRPHGGLRASTMVILGTVQFVSMFGYLGGFFDRIDGKLEWHVFLWDVGTIVYTAVMWVSWALAVTLLLMSNEKPETKIGGGLVISLPLAVFVMLFFEWIKLGPR